MICHPLFSPACALPASPHPWRCGRRCGGRSTSFPAESFLHSRCRTTGSAWCPAGEILAPCLGYRAMSWPEGLEKNSEGKTICFFFTNFIQISNITCFRLLECAPLRGKGRPTECWQRTNSTPSASFFKTGVPIRVIIPMLATTYGESVTFNENKDFLRLSNPRL